jgi:hypothetical protein
LAVLKAARYTVSDRSLDIRRVQFALHPGVDDVAQGPRSGFGILPGRRM